MRNDKIIPGMVLVIIGTLFLLDNFGVIDFNWWSLFQFWPVLLIMAGINLVFAHNNTPWATTLKIAVLLLGMAVIIISGLNKKPSGWMGWTYNDRYDDNFDTSGSEYKGTSTDSVVKFNGHTIYRKAFTPGTKTAELNISGGVTTYTINGTTTDLFQAATNKNESFYTLDTHVDSATQVLDFDMASSKNNIGFNTSSNPASIRLNPIPEWEINVQTGVTKVNFDLSQFKIKKLGIQGGAASYRVKMGEPLVNTSIDISTGVAKVYVSIPKDAACHISSDTPLSSRSFDGFESKDDGIYETPGYDKAVNKMTINIDGGVSHFKVTRY